jgi:hypothetical protein
MARVSIRPVVLFVFGMGRSGSSALARVLSLCGGALPCELVGATESNPLGHWEPQGALDLNDAFLYRHGATWFDPTLRLQGEIDIGPAQRAAYIDQIVAFLRSLPAAPLLVIKEPRITALAEFWFEAVRQAQLSMGVVVPVRHPEEVVASLAARDRATPELASALWLKYNLLAERQSRAAGRVFVEYVNLLRDWRAEIFRISQALSVDLSVRDEGAIEEFVRPDLRRQRERGQLREPFAPRWISRVYAALSGAARDEPIDTTALDEIFESFRACERAFRVAFEDFGARSDPENTARGARNPNIARLIHAVAGGDSQALRFCLNSRWYREHNPDVAAARVDPYEHWIVYGVNEGRLPCEDPLSLLDQLMGERTGRNAATPTDGTAKLSSPAPACR